MKKFLFLATALSVAVTSITPMVSAANSFGLEDTKDVSVDIKVESKLNGTEYADHSSSNPLVADVKKEDATVQFSTKATLDMSTVAEVWNDYIDAGLKSVQQVVPTFTRDAVLDTVKLDGNFTITVKADENVKPQQTADETYDLIWDQNAQQLFDQGEVKVEGNTYTVEMSFKETEGINKAMDTFLNGENPELSVEFKTVNMTGVQAEAYEISADFAGSVEIMLPTNTDENMKVNFAGDDDQYVKLSQIIEVTKPTVRPIPTVDPSATQAPTQAPIENNVSLTIGAAISTAMPEDEGSDTSYGDYADKELAAVTVNVKTENSEAAAYGDDYVAKIVVNDEPIYLGEEEFANIISGNMNEDNAVSDAVKTAITGKTLREVVDMLQIESKDTNSVYIAPVFEVSEGIYEEVAGLGTGVEQPVVIPTETPEPTTAPTRKPALGGGGGGGGVVTPKPTATANPDATAAPTATAAPVVTATPVPNPQTGGTENGAKLNYTDHMAYIVGYPAEDGGEPVNVRPTANITRAEVATIFYRILDADSKAKFESTTNDFSDVNTGDWFNDAISTVAAAGIVNGYEDGTFKPNNNITRAEFAAIISRFTTLEGESTFTDIAGHWAEGAIIKAAATGWITGYEDGTFRPNNNITRAEAMTMINRVLYRIVDANVSNVDMHNTWADNPEGTWYYAAVQEATNDHDYDREDIGHVEVWTESEPETTETPEATEAPATTEAPEATEAPAE